MQQESLTLIARPLTVVHLEGLTVLLFNFCNRNTLTALHATTNHQRLRVLTWTMQSDAWSAKFYVAAGVLYEAWFLLGRAHTDYGASCLTRGIDCCAGG